MDAAVNNSDRPPAAPPSRRAVLVALVIGLVSAVVGYRLWFKYHSISFDEPGPAAQRLIPWVAGVAVLIMALWLCRPTHAALAHFLDRIRAPRRRARTIASVAIAIFSACYFYGTAVEFERALAPLWHDSNQHMVQAQLLMHGKLWSAPHALADQMETFFVLTTPVYAAIHFPGTSMLYAPLLALGVPPAVFSALMTGAIVGLMYRITCEVLDGVAGALVVPYILGLSMVRELGVMLLSHHTFLVPTLLAFWAFLRWRRSANRRLGWALAIGCFVAYAGIMRPVEALSYGLAIGLAMMIELWPQGWRKIALTVVLLVVGASPWIALQLVFNYNVTGHLLRPPYEEYVQRYHPQTSYGSYADISGIVPIPTNLPQKVDYYESFIRARLEDYEYEGALSNLFTYRLPQSFGVLTPFPFAIAFWVPALLTIRRSRRRMIFATATGFFWAFYLPHVFFLAHYPVALVPVAGFLAVSGVGAVGEAFAGGRRSAELLAALALLACSLAGVPELDRYMHDSGTPWAKMGKYVNGPMRDEVEKPAVILSRYRLWTQPYDRARDNPHDEPVYTIDTLWPEDSPIARLQDLGPERNRATYAFFAARQPERTFYLLDRRWGKLVRLGTAAELLAHGEPEIYFRALRNGPATTKAAGR